MIPALCKYFSRHHNLSLTNPDILVCFVLLDAVNVTLEAIK